MRVVPCLLAACCLVKGPSSAKGSSVARSSPDQSPRQTSPALFAAVPDGPLLTLTELNRRGIAYHSVLAVPAFEDSVAEVDRSVSNTIRGVNLALDQIGSCRQNWVTFGNSVSYLDDVRYEVRRTANRFVLLRNIHTNAAVRQAAWEATKQLAIFAVGLDYRQNVYTAVRKYAAGFPMLHGEDDRIVREILRDYQRAGYGLTESARAEVRRMREELAGLVGDFESHLYQARQPVKFTRAELAGVPEDFLQQERVKIGTDEFTIEPALPSHFQMVMRHARLEATRQKLAVAAEGIARDKNGPLLQRIVELRSAIARKLGYGSWGDYQNEPRMARSAGNAQAFCASLQERIQPEFAATVEELRRMKARDTGDATVKIQDWDWRYYANQLQKERYEVDAEELRVYFPYEKCMSGLMQMSEEVFGLKFERVKPPPGWCAGLQLFAVSDAETTEPLGLLYLDMFSREGKDGHSHSYSLIDGMLTPSRNYLHPTVALVSSFPPATSDKPTLLTHDEVETLFHDFGCALQTILTRAKFGRFSDTRGAAEFFEASSGVFESWAWDRRVVDSFAADYRDPSKKLPRKILTALKNARRATASVHYQRELALAKLDLELHTEVTADNHRSAMELANQILTDNFLPPAGGTAAVTVFEPLSNNGAGYYGYVWADVIGADMTSAFKRSVGGLYDTRSGHRMRTEVYGPGGSRDASRSIEAFLQRKQSTEPFWKTVGITGSGRMAQLTGH